MTASSHSPRRPESLQSSTRPAWSSRRRRKVVVHPRRSRLQPRAGRDPAPLHRLTPRTLKPLLSPCKQAPLFTARALSSCPGVLRAPGSSSSLGPALSTHQLSTPRFPPNEEETERLHDLPRVTQALGEPARTSSTWPLRPQSAECVTKGPEQAAACSLRRTPPWDSRDTVRGGLQHIAFQRRKPRPHIILRNIQV